MKCLQQYSKTLRIDKNTLRVVAPVDGDGIVVMTAGSQTGNPKSIFIRSQFSSLCFVKSVFRKCYCVITSGLAGVVSFWFWFYLKKWGCGVRRGKGIIFLFLVLSRKWGSAVNLRCPCLIPGVGRFSLTQPRVVENRWVGRERNQEQKPGIKPGTKRCSFSQL